MKNEPTWSLHYTTKEGQDGILLDGVCYPADETQFFLSLSYASEGNTLAWLIYEMYQEIQSVWVQCLFDEKGCSKLHDDVC